MAKVRVSAAARRDLERIATDGVRDHGLSASAHHLEGFRRLFRLLRDHPFAGQEWFEPDLGVRTLSHRPHRIVHRVDGDGVVIDRVLHLARDIGRALRENH
jgi:toxin ParE1/3/4